MTIAPNSVWLVTGASTGFGAEFVKQALAAGHRVVATARDPAVLACGVTATACLSAPSTSPTPSNQPKKSWPMRKPISDRSTSSSTMPASATSGRSKRVDEEAIRRVFEVNVFGLARLTRLVLPGMRAPAGHGRQPQFHRRAERCARCRLLRRHQVRGRGAVEILAAEVAGFGMASAHRRAGPLPDRLHGPLRSRSRRPTPPMRGRRRRTTTTFSSPSTASSPAIPPPRSAWCSTLALDKPPLRLLIGKAAIDRALTPAELRAREHHGLAEKSRSPPSSDRRRLSDTPKRRTAPGVQPRGRFHLRPSGAGPTSLGRLWGRCRGRPCGPPGGVDRQLFAFGGDGPAKSIL